MHVITSVEFQRRVGEYRRLKRRDRDALPVTALGEEDLRAIAGAEVPAEYTHLDDELGG